MSNKDIAAQTITVLVVDDHQLLRGGIALAIQGQPDMVLVGEATNGLEAIAKYREHRPAVTLMDVRMPEMNGIEALAAIRQEFPASRIIMLTTYRGDVQAMHAIKMGAAGYLLKSSLREELVDTIRAVHAGHRRIPPEIATELALQVGNDALSEREVEVLRLIASGNSNKRVGTLLNIAEQTVKAHVRSIMSKLGANDRTHAVTIALQRGIIVMP